jgi:cyclic pyranopterin phosphate synthase
MPMTELTHLDSSGRATMVDVSEKAVTRREAKARAVVTMAPDALEKIRENALAKGDALVVARIAAIQAAKRTDELIPLCHGLPLASVGVEFEFGSETLTITTTAVTTAQTGVEMEALTAASVAALTIYDMAKAVDRTMHIDGIRLLAKSGGRSGDYRWTE